MIKIAPVLSKALRRAGATYRVGPISWGKYLLHVECVVRDVQRYHMRVRSSLLVAPDGVQVLPEQQWEWEGAWGEPRILHLS